MNEPVLTIVGNVTFDPELKFLASGAPVANFTVACTPRTFDKQANEWRDGTTLFMPCHAWRDLAEHVAESITKGTRVVVTGRLKQHNWESKEGEKRSRLELEVDEIGPSLRYATATVAKVQRGAHATGGSDPWGSAPSFESEPPF